VAAPVVASTPSLAFSRAGYEQHSAFNAELAINDSTEAAAVGLPGGEKSSITDQNGATQRSCVAAAESQKFF
jgi:hypothetical protein